MHDVSQNRTVLYEQGSRLAELDRVPVLKKRWPVLVIHVLCLIVSYVCVCYT